MSYCIGVAPLLCFLLFFCVHLPVESSLAREVPREVVIPSVYYDAFATRIYDPRGRVLQLEYALAATKKGGAAAAAALGDYAVIASWTPRTSRRQIRASKQRALGTWEAYDHVAVAACGLATDGLALAESVRRECLSHKYIYGSPARIGRLVKELAKEMSETERRRLVPFAVDVLVCGVDEEAGARLYNVGPAGVFLPFEAYAVGKNAERAKEYLSSRLNDQSGPYVAGRCTLRELVELVLSALRKTIDSRGASRSGEGSGLWPTEDFTLAVIARGVPYTPLQVDWDPNSRRLEVSIPEHLAERFAS